MITTTRVFASVPEVGGEGDQKAWRTLGSSSHTVPPLRGTQVVRDSSPKKSTMPTSCRKHSGGPFKAASSAVLDAPEEPGGPLEAPGESPPPIGAVTYSRKLPQGENDISRHLGLTNLQQRQREREKERTNETAVSGDVA